MSQQTPISGQSASGEHGRSDGESGQERNKGENGNIGYAGKNAPRITMFVLDIPSSGPEINLQGQNAGQGGRGQRGGDGENGGSINF